MTSTDDRDATISHCCERHMIQRQTGQPYSGECDTTGNVVADDAQPLTWAEAMRRIHTIRPADPAQINALRAAAMQAGRDTAARAVDAELAEMGAGPVAAMPEAVRREIANAHRGEVVEGSGVAIEPRELPPAQSEHGHLWALDQPGGYDACTRCGMYRFAYYNADNRRPCAASLEQDDVRRETPAQPDAAPPPDGANAAGVDVAAIRARYEDAQPGRWPVQLAARKARQSADDVPALLADNDRLRARIHEAVDETQRRYARYQSRCDEFDEIARWARNMLNNGGVSFDRLSTVVRFALVSIAEERDRARADLAEARLVNESLAAAVERAHERCVSRAELLTVRRERDEALDAVAQVTHERDGWLADCRQLTSLNKQILVISQQLERERDEARAAVERLSRDRADMAKTIRALVKPDDEARAKTDGGEWATRYYADAEEADHHTLRSTVRRPNHTHQRRVWLGPVEPVTDDGGAG